MEGDIRINDERRRDGEGVKRVRFKKETLSTEKAAARIVDSRGG